MVKETRNIKTDVQNELWGRAAGRCEICNRIVYKSPLTHERVNISEKAHIYSFSKDGPRGRGPYAKKPKLLNQVSNLILACHDCHKLIDKDTKGVRFSAELLQSWKQEHERRIKRVTGVHPSKASHVILYGGKIGAEDSPLQPDLAMEAMFPHSLPAEEAPMSLSLSYEHEDTSPAFWATEARHLRAAFERYVVPKIKEAKPNHFSVFARANQPLLVLLGALLTDKVPGEVYQLRREPVTWKWRKNPSGFVFRVNRPANKKGQPVLVLSLSAKINQDRVTAVLGTNVSIWELTIREPHNDFLKSREQLASYRETVRKLMVEIASVHGQKTPLAIFPAMPVACAVELGRVRMPKADMPWVIYDQNNKLGKFIKALKL